MPSPSLVTSCHGKPDILAEKRLENGRVASDMLGGLDRGKCGK
jgi:hypothetical protein